MRTENLDITKVFYSPTNAQVIDSKNNIKIQKYSLHIKNSGYWSLSWAT